MDFKQILPAESDLNVFDTIGRRWMLITARKPDGTFNAMTASWGGMGVIWGKNVFVCLIRPQRFTHGFAEEASGISLSFFGEEHKPALGICGRKSGRNTDKIALAGFTPVIDGDFVYYEEATDVILGEKIYKSEIKKDGFIGIDQSQWYEDDFHTAYVCEIKKILKKA